MEKVTFSVSIKTYHESHTVLYYTFNKKKKTYVFQITGSSNDTSYYGTSGERTEEIKEEHVIVDDKGLVYLVPELLFDPGIFGKPDVNLVVQAARQRLRDGYEIKHIVLSCGDDAKDVTMSQTVYVSMDGTVRSLNNEEVTGKALTMVIPKKTWYDTLNNTSTMIHTWIKEKI